ncbi:metabotropic glutamate receptor 3-like isoform X2 [Actinia tenebrosa]|uniref:Metabotropic glutamate receptor 3-like isoform X1 n=1 Tax=Actinia tenebrosa TaxID=6105 RepID=A0A6P8IJZ6_ACTTE|nr:metabotropic glutamate receptor 3-like isoform X1 [Actinia tenebrosa]XP_031566764.1 metabotropic glutamate receptor 3-like isoform X2 [Actinia tenebrosa]
MLIEKDAITRKMANIVKLRTKQSFIFGMLLLLLILIKTAKPERLDKYQEGDLILGGMFPIHSKSCSCVTSSDEDCHQIYPKGLFLAEAMVYAVMLVNQRGILPYDMSLGYNIRDTCNTLDMAVKNALVFVTQRKRKSMETIDDFQKALGKHSDPFSLNGDISMGNNHSAIIAVVGAGNSELSLAVNNILTLFNIPQVGYASSSAVFSDKTRYKTFLRVLPPDNLQAKAIAQLFAHFKWNYVSLVSSNDHYAGPLRESFRQEIQRLGICLANDIIFSYLPSKNIIEKALMSIKQTNKARVVLVFASERSAKVILQAAESLNLTGRIWVASDSWSNAVSLFNQYFSVLKGSLGIMFAVTPVPEFLVHLKNRLNKSAEDIHQDPWLRSLNEAVQNEKLTSLINNYVNANPESKQNLSNVMKIQSVFARVDYVINSVFILANVIRDFCFRLNVSSGATKAEKRAFCLKNLNPQSLLPLLFNRTLTGFNKNLTVDQHGDPPGSYDFFNLQQSEEGEEHEQKNLRIGSYESLSKVLKLNDSVIDLGQGKGTVLISRCSDTCLPGAYVVKRNSKHTACCWDCKTCPPGHISNVTMATECMECNIAEHLPNENRTQCVYVPLKYLTRAHPWSIFISICSLLCFFLAVFFVWVFIRHRRSPVVRASCFEISLVLLLSIAVGFLLPLVIMRKPSHLQCRASAFLFAVVFAVILSLTLAKINRTVLILNNRMGGGGFHRKFLLSRRAHFMSVLIFSAIQVSICITWFFLNPPKPKVSTIPFPDFVRFLHCTSHKNPWFLVSSGFLILLSIICTAIAFKSRNFPENYNHARFISLAMFTFNVVWITFMGAYYGNPQPGIHQVIIHCCAIIFSNLCLMMLIYGPKVYVIFFRPELNNARTFREMNLQHLLGGPERGRNFSFAVGTPGHGNVYLMEQCDPNEKAVQTVHILTYNAQTQTDFKERVPIRRHKSSLVNRIFGRGGWRKTGDIIMVSSSPQHKRVWSESDAIKTRKHKSLSHCQSSPVISNSHCHTDNQAKPLLRDFDSHSSDAFGLHSIEEAKESPATSRSRLRNAGNQDIGDFESTTTNQYSCFSEEDADNNDGDDEDESTVNDVRYDDVFTTTNSKSV